MSVKNMSNKEIMDILDSKTITELEKLLKNETEKQIKSEKLFNNLIKEDKEIEKITKETKKEIKKLKDAKDKEKTNYYYKLLKKSLIYYDFKWYIKNHLNNNKWECISDYVKTNKEIIETIKDTLQIKPWDISSEDKIKIIIIVTMNNKLDLNNVYNPLETETLLNIKNGTINKKLYINKNKSPFHLSYVNYELNIDHEIKNKELDSLFKYYLDKEKYTLDIDFKSKLDNHMINVFDYLFWMCNSNTKRLKILLMVIFSCLISKNNGMFPILYSKRNNTGKSTFISLIKALGNKNVIARDASSFFSNNSNFTLSGINYNTTALFVEEIGRFLGKTSSELIKRVCDSTAQTIATENKGKDINEIPNNITLIGTTNTVINFTELDEALATRILVINIGSKCDYYLKDIKKLFDKKALQFLFKISYLAYDELNPYGKDGLRAKDYTLGLKDTELYLNASLDQQMVSFDRYLYKNINNGNSIYNIKLDVLLNEYKSFIEENTIFIKLNINKFLKRLEFACDRKHLKNFINFEMVNENYETIIKLKKRDNKNKIINDQSKKVKKELEDKVYEEIFGKEEK